MADFNGVILLFYYPIYWGNYPISCREIALPLSIQFIKGEK